ncbi:AI-2E family transporter [Bacillus sp. BRMEA1]|uniref:AI-2E family transporter n=1 Tax=Neobacillus endophyticus TaxID=2738405 RepID=UPI001563058D|nr:AI-2E family transporter [Neobacillus endophyticus]NRD75939.1 AI-2E family transporter [Neobacillus endophyticus]
MDIRMKWYWRIGFILLILISLYVFLKIRFVWIPILKVAGIIILPFLIAGFITYLLHPIVEKLHEKGLHRGLAILFIYVLFFGGIGFALYKGIPAFIDQMKDLSENAPVFAEQYRSWINAIQAHTRTWPDGLQGRMNDGIDAFEETVDSMLSLTIDILVKFLKSALVIVIIPFIAFYMLKDIQLVKRVIWYLVPRQWRRQGARFLKEVDDSLGSYIRGQILVCVIIGGAAALLFWFFHLRYPLLLGFIVGVTDVIPYFGAIIGALPAVIIAATVSVKLVMITIIIILVLQFLEGNILSPYIFGKSLHMHPLLIMLAITAGGEIGGVIGLIIAVPVLVVLKAGIVHAKNLIVQSKNKE